MKNRPIKKFIFALSLVAFLSGIFAGGVSASSSRKGKDGELGKLHASMGITCAQCHENVKKPAAVPMLKCVSCHGPTEKLAAKTAHVKPRNPHENRHYGTEADCNLCHHQHKKSVNFCLPCHQRFNFVVP